MRLIVYIDDILILVESEDMARDHAIGLVYLLENLGFAVSKAASANTERRVFGFRNRHVQARTESSQWEDKKDQSRHALPARRQASGNQEAVPTTGQATGGYQGGAPGTFILSQAPACAEAGPGSFRPGLLAAVDTY